MACNKRTKITERNWTATLSVLAISLSMGAAQKDHARNDGRSATNQGYAADAWLFLDGADRYLVRHRQPPPLFATLTLTPGAAKST